MLFSLTESGQSHMPPSYVLAADIESGVMKGGMRQQLTEIEDVCILFVPLGRKIHREVVVRGIGAHHQPSLPVSLLVPRQPLGLFSGPNISNHLSALPATEVIDFIQATWTASDIEVCVSLKQNAKLGLLLFSL